MLSRIRQIIRRVTASAAERERMEAARTWKASDGDHTLRLQYPLTRDSVVIDAGGYRGQWASDIYAIHRCQVHLFEPVSAFADLIAERFSANPDITVHRVALGARDGSVAFGDAADATGRFTAGPTRSVPMREAARYFREYGLTHIDLLKLNIEGDEYDLLDNLCEAGMLPAIRFLQVQFHPFVPDADRRLEQAHALLAKTHVPRYSFKYVWEGWERIT